MINEIKKTKQTTLFKTIPLAIYNWFAWWPNKWAIADTRAWRK